MSKKQDIARFYESMTRMGFTYEETETLRRAQLTLRRWAERECNGEIERDEETGKTFAFREYRGETRTGYTVPDLETGALRRIKETVDARNKLEWSKDEQLRGASIDAAYSRGFAVCI